MCPNANPKLENVLKWLLSYHKQVGLLSLVGDVLHVVGDDALSMSCHYSVGGPAESATHTILDVCVWGRWGRVLWGPETDIQRKCQSSETKQTIPAYILQEAWQNDPTQKVTQ